MAEPTWRGGTPMLHQRRRLIARALQAGAAPLIALADGTELRTFNELKRAEGMTMRRRHFLTGMAVAAGGMLLPPRLADAADAPPEGTSVPRGKNPALRHAPAVLPR